MTKNPAALREEPEFKSTAVLPYIKRVSETVRRTLQQQGIRTVFKSNRTLRSRFVRQKDPADPKKQDGVVYRIPCECGKNDIAETGQNTTEIYAEHALRAPPLQNTPTRPDAIRCGKM